MVAGGVEWVVVVVVKGNGKEVMLGRMMMKMIMGKMGRLAEEVAKRKIMIGLKIDEVHKYQAKYHEKRNLRRSQSLPSLCVHLLPS